MSFDTTIAHLRTQLASGTTHRRRHEQRRRTTTLAGLGVLVALTAGFLAVRHDNAHGPRVATTALTASQHALCEAFLDYVNFRPDPNDASMADAQRRAGRPVVDLARQLPTDDPLAIGRHLTDPADTSSIDAFNGLWFGCRDLGHPDFNPVYVAARIPAPTDLDDLLIGWVPQPFRGTTEAPGPFKRPSSIGHDMSVVQTAVTDAGAYLAAWNFRDAANRRIYCLSYGTRDQGGSNCSPYPTASTGSDLPVTVLTGGSPASPYTAIETTTPVARIVAQRSGQRIVQQPVLNRAVIVWNTTSTEPVTIRAYDTTGQLLTCFTNNGTSC